MARAHEATLNADNDARDDQLYERYGRPLEMTSHGQVVAIADDGRTIVGSDELGVARDAIDQFGAGRFALRRIGATAEGRWRRPGR